MRVLVIGAGGVGSAVIAIAARRDFFEQIVVADYDPGRAARAVPAGDPRFIAAQIDASHQGAVERLIAIHRITHVLNAVDPRYVLPIFLAAQHTGVDYLDLAMSLSSPHPEDPYHQVGTALGAEQ